MVICTKVDQAPSRSSREPRYKNGYNNLSAWGKFHFKIAAITSGRIESDVHKDFHQAEGIVNVITNSESIEVSSEDG